MRYDLFISYSRLDNEQGRISELVYQIKADFQIFDGTDRILNVYFDMTEINCMDDWRHKILQGLRESHLLLVCLSPSYLKSEYCEWEFNEYLTNERLISIMRSVVHLLEKEWLRFILLKFPVGATKILKKNVLTGLKNFAVDNILIFVRGFMKVEKACLILQ